MTARPDEVVAHRWLRNGEVTFTGWIPGLPSARSLQAQSDCNEIPDVEWTIEYAIPESALQSANARLADLSLERDAILDDLADHVRRLAAVLALADNMKTEAVLKMRRAFEMRANGSAVTEDYIRADRLQDIAGEIHEYQAELRRAAAGEGDANQGDCDGKVS